MSRSFGLEGKKILVTGASSGIGFGAAKAFLGEGANVVINSSNRDRLSKAHEKLGKEGNVHSIVADITKEKDLDRLVAGAVRKLGGLDTLVYVTGQPATGRFLEKDYSDWRAAADLMMISPAYLARLVATQMIDSKVRGSMVFLGSITMREPVLTIAVSGVARIGVSGLVRTLARELGPKGIRVNGILPGYIETARVEAILKDRVAREGISRAKAVEEMVAEIPMGRLGTTEELAQVVMFLASDLSSYVSGALIPVDGALLRSTG